MWVRIQILYITILPQANRPRVQAVKPYHTIPPPPHHIITISIFERSLTMYFVLKKIDFSLLLKIVRQPA